MFVRRVLRDIGRRERGVDIQSGDGFRDTENRGYACDGRVVVFQTLDRGGYGDAGCYGIRQDQNMFSADRYLHIVTEDDLVIGSVLRRNDIDGLVRVVGNDAGSGQRLGEKRPDYLCPVQADDGVDRSGAGIAHREHLGDTLRLADSGFHRRHVKIAGNVRVRSSKVSVDHLQSYVRIFFRRNFDIRFHDSPP